MLFRQRHSISLLQSLVDSTWYMYCRILPEFPTAQTGLKNGHLVLVDFFFEDALLVDFFLEELSTQKEERRRLEAKLNAFKGTFRRLSLAPLTDAQQATAVEQRLGRERGPFS